MTDTSIYKLMFILSMDAFYKSTEKLFDSKATSIIQEYTRSYINDITKEKSNYCYYLDANFNKNYLLNLEKNFFNTLSKNLYKIEISKILILLKSLKFNNKNKISLQKKEELSNTIGYFCEYLYVYISEPLNINNFCDVQNCYFNLTTEEKIIPIESNFLFYCDKKTWVTGQTEWDMHINSIMSDNEGDLLEDAIYFYFIDSINPTFYKLYFFDYIFKLYPTESKEFFNFISNKIEKNSFGQKDNIITLNKFLLESS